MVSGTFRVPEGADEEAFGFQVLGDEAFGFCSFTSGVDG